MTKVSLSSPWALFYKQIKAFFGKDPEIRVLYNEDGPEIKLYVASAAKAAGLAALLPATRLFGNVILKLTVVPPNDAEPLPEYPDGTPGIAQALQDALEGNPIVGDFHEIDAMGWHAYYILFIKEVVQYFCDNMGDWNGCISTLYQDLAKEIFPSLNGFFFCTAIDGAPLGKPLGEWP